MSLVDRQRAGYIAARVAEAAAEAEQHFEHCMLGCESPIEQLFFAQLLETVDVLDPREDICRELYDLRELRRDRTVRHPASAAITFRVPGLSADCELLTQMPVRVEGSSMRLDFGLMVHPWSRGPVDLASLLWVDIECDGHDYHERTSAQAATDRSRDRKLARAGWLVVRFTGSELYKAADGCVAELFGVLDSRMNVSA